MAHRRQADAGVPTSFPSIPLNIGMLIQGDYVVATVLISFGAIIGRVSAMQCLVMLFFEVIFATANVQIGFELNVTDPGGSMLIHTFGAAFGLAVAWVIGDAALKGKGNGESKLGTSRHNGTFASECRGRGGGGGCGVMCQRLTGDCTNQLSRARSSLLPRLPRTTPRARSDRHALPVLLLAVVQRGHAHRLRAAARRHQHGAVHYVVHDHRVRLFQGHPRRLALRHGAHPELHAGGRRRHRRRVRHDQVRARGGERGQPAGAFARSPSSTVPVTRPPPTTPLRTPCSNPFGALLAGSVAGVVSVYGFSFLVPALKRVGVTDTCGSE
jgi:hypothetical protein